MELDINKDCGIALIWLTQEESADPAVGEHLKPVYAKCRALSPVGNKNAEGR